MKRLDRKFFNRPTVKVAQELLGKILVRKIPSASSGQAAKIIKAKITETEAYCGIKDQASHASRGLTERIKVMFGPAGFSYVYMIYGMYHCLNVVTEKEGKPSAVLIRGIEISSRGPAAHYPMSARPKSFARSWDPHSRHPDNTKLILNGPGKICRELKIDKKLNDVDITKSNLLWIENGKIKTKIKQIKKGKRIGVDYAGKWKDKLWRFWL